MPWFERPLIAVLRHEYTSAMRFADSGGGAVMPAPPAAPCQLYVHVPFCEVLCPFCSFHRVRFNASKSQRYFQALRREIALYHEAGFRFGDIYVGGGTPTVDVGQLIETLDCVRARSPVRSISVETNPNYLQPELLGRLRDAGVTRLSVGVQSFDDGLLAGMERLEKYGNADVIRRRLAQAQGILPALNVDMIFNLPGQTLAMLEHDLDVVQSLEIDQASFYPLMTARSARHAMQKSMGLSDPGLRHAMYERILDRMLATHRAASAWCFSRSKGQFDEYIIDQDDYVGVGSGAFSYIGDAMYSTTFSLQHYCQRVEGGCNGVTQRRTLSPKERMRYDFLVRLFGGELDRGYIERRWGRAFAWRMAPELAAMRLIGAIRIDRDMIRLTPRGMYCWMLMMAEFFNSVNDVRERMREHVRQELDTWNDEVQALHEVSVPLAAVGRGPARIAAAAGLATAAGVPGVGC